MTLPVVMALYAEWRRVPPVHELFAAFCGVKPEAHSSGMNPDDWKNFTSQFESMPGARKREKGAPLWQTT